VLELGTGRGELWRENAERIPDGWRLTITDLSPGMVEAARRSGVPAEYAVVDAQDIPYADGSFDAVIANHMLYHVPDRAQALTEIRRVLVPCGRAYATTIGADHMLELRELTRRHAPGYEWTDSHVRFGLETGGSQLEAFFVDVRLEYRDAPLRVTDPDAVVAFIHSLAGAGDADGDAVRAAVAAEIAAHGVFHIRSAAGLFTARKP
jgi:SAM-dependent methyltransferase